MILSPMTVIDDHGRPEPPLTGDELATLQGFLEYQRATFAWKCSGLDAAGLAAAVGASSLGGMLKRHNGHADLIRESLDGATGE